MVTLVTFVALAWLLASCYRGFDITDESYYLIWMADPWRYPVSVTQFGFVYHPLYLLIGGDIAILRQINVLGTFLLAWALCLLTLRCCGASSMDRPHWRSPTSLAIAAVLATSSLIAFRLMLLTPSYNSLCFQALMVAGCGLLLAEQRLDRISLVGWVLIGLGGWLGFMGKPTTAMAMALWSPLFLLISGRLSWRGAGLAALVAAVMLVISAMYIDSSVETFYCRMRAGIYTGELLESGHTLRDSLRIDVLPLPSLRLMALLLGALAISIAAGLTLARYQWLRFAILSGTVAVSVMALTMIVGNWLPQFKSTPFLGTLILMVSVGAVLLALALGFGRSSWPVPRRALAVALCFPLAPHALAFGTNNNYWEAGSQAAIFWLLGGLGLLLPFLSREHAARVMLPLLVVGQAIAILIVQWAFTHPYRQPQPLWRLNTPVAVGGAGGTLWVHAELAEYTQELRRQAADAGFIPGMPMIDLTGESPGGPYLLGAAAIGQPWMVGGYPGSRAMAKDMLGRVPASELKRAWLLVEPGGSRQMPVELLADFGLFRAGGYQEVGRVLAPRFTATEPLRPQFILRPVP